MSKVVTGLRLKDDQNDGARREKHHGRQEMRDCEERVAGKQSSLASVRSI